MKRREFLGTLALAGAVRAAGEVPEKKSPTEALDLQRKIEQSSGPSPCRAAFTHIGTEK